MDVPLPPKIFDRVTIAAKEAHMTRDAWVERALRKQREER
jgi:hypothetical protein